MNDRTAFQHPLSDLGFESVSRTLHDLGFEPEKPHRPSPGQSRREWKLAHVRATDQLSLKASKAVKADEKEGALRPIIAQATNKPQPIGGLEQSAGRVITQPTDNPAVNQALATDAMRAYRSGLHSAIKNILGAQLAASREAKNPQRLAEKIELEDQPAQTVNDYGAAQISVDSPLAKDAVIAAVSKEFPVIRTQDHFAQGDPQYGYRSYSMQLQMPNGASQELQIVPKEVFEANPAEHKNYKKARNAELADRDANNLRAAAKAQNDAAMAKFNRRNSLSGLRKGVAVVLQDGRKGTISYLDSNMKIARVRTEDGRNLTLRQSRLKIAE